MKMASFVMIKLSMFIAEPAEKLFLSEMNFSNSAFFARNITALIYRNALKQELTT